MGRGRGLSRGTVRCVIKCTRRQTDCTGGKNGRVYCHSDGQLCGSGLSWALGFYNALTRTPLALDRPRAQTAWGSAAAAAQQGASGAVAALTRAMSPPSGGSSGGGSGSGGSLTGGGTERQLDEALARQRHTDLKAAYDMLLRSLSCFVRDKVGHRQHDTFTRTAAARRVLQRHCTVQRHANSTRIILYLGNDRLYSVAA